MPSTLSEQMTDALKAAADAAVAQLQHQIIEQAKDAYKNGSGNVSWEWVLESTAERMVKPPYQYLVGEQNDVWSLDVWIENLEDRV